MDVTAQALEASIATLAPHTHAASERDAILGAQPRIVVEPETEEQVAAILRFANSEGLAVIPRGGGTQLAYGAPPRRADIILSLTRLRQVIEHAPHDLTFTAQSGIRLADLQATLAESRQWLALDPILDPGATLGGVIATNATGARRLRYGGVRDQLLGVRVALADGTLARGGGKVVKNVAGYDLPKLFTGALGTLGVVLSASFRLYPTPVASATALLEADQLAPLGAIAQRILAAPLTPVALDIFSPADSGAHYTLAVRFQSGVEAAVTEQTLAVCGDALAAGALSRATHTGEDDARFWATHAERWRAPLPAQVDGERVTVKASLPIAEVAGWLLTLESACANSGLARVWQAHAGHGIVHARLAGSATALAEAITMLRQEATARRGSLVVTELPTALAGVVDPWGAVAALAVMRNLKARFDSQSTLNPGRFVGGI